MNMLIYLIPIALVMGAMGLLAFLWSLRSGQYDDLQGAAWRVLLDDDADPADAEHRAGAPGKAPAGPLIAAPRQSGR
jgi:cbb3-type cytochrome oxidase maturation protein